MLAVARHERVDPEIVRAGVAAGTIVICRRAGRAAPARSASEPGSRSRSTPTSAPPGPLGSRPNCVKLEARRGCRRGRGDGPLHRRRPRPDPRARSSRPAPSPSARSRSTRPPSTARAHPGRLDRMEPDALFDAIERQAARRRLRDGALRADPAEPRPRARQGASSASSAAAAPSSPSGCTGAAPRTRSTPTSTACWTSPAAHDLVLSLGDALRPGCGADATDRAQVAGAPRAGRAGAPRPRGRRPGDGRGAGAHVDGADPGNVLLEKRLCGGAPFYVLGPLVTDFAPGYDHITAAIGGALAAWAGADFLCYVTPAEHLGLPGIEDVRQGVIASKIAAHAADLARGNAAALARDREFSRCRRPWTGPGRNGSPSTLRPSPRAAAAASCRAGTSARCADRTARSRGCARSSA